MSEKDKKMSEKKKGEKEKVGERKKEKVGKRKKLAEPNLIYRGHPV